ncbi:plant UBX domain-containing protein 5-like [Hibiscus syriacus]|uniref:plant UBX domain-containing protein 5-like n=1 Tax=Hibiscus syriacus TaxID=106335 RepID=UPI001922C3A6|nr:plant UBX domain-containing protein 5-like [Hibiscus syriacus]
MSATDQNDNLINSYVQIAYSSEEEGIFFLESHQWDLDVVVSTFFDNNSTVAHQPHSIASPVFGPVSLAFSCLPLSLPYTLWSRRNVDKKSSDSDGSNARDVRTLADLNRSPPGGSDSEKSGMVVRDPSRHQDVDSIFNQARQAGAVEGSDDYLQPSSSFEHEKLSITFEEE